MRLSSFLIPLAMETLFSYVFYFHFNMFQILFLLSYSIILLRFLFVLSICNKLYSLKVMYHSSSVSLDLFCLKGQRFFCSAIVLCPCMTHNDIFPPAFPPIPLISVLLGCVWYCLEVSQACWLLCVSVGWRLNFVYFSFKIDW